MAIAHSIPIRIVDVRGLSWFVVLTFIPTIAAAAVLWVLGISFDGKDASTAQVSAGACMFIPGIAAVIVRRFITHEGFGDAGLRWGASRYYGVAWLATLLVYVAVYGITTAFVHGPDLSMHIITSQYSLNLPVAPAIMIGAIFLASITIAPVINSIPAFGEEFGWRGYLLPKLMPLGRRRALVFSGITWGLWHAPFVLLGFHYPYRRCVGVLLFTAIVTALGILIGELRLVSGSVLVAAFAHGLFNSQYYGPWAVLFPQPQLVSPFAGGMSGVPGLIVLAVPTAVILMRSRTRASDDRVS